MITHKAITEKMAKISVKDTEVSVIRVQDEDYISLTDMLKAKDGEFFFSHQPYRHAESQRR